VVAAAAAAGFALGGCGGAASRSRSSTAAGSSAVTTSSSSGPAATASSSGPATPSSSGPASSAAAGPSPLPAPNPRARLIAVLPAAHRAGLFHWAPAVAVRGVPAAWISRVSARGESGFTVTLLRFDQRQLTLALHAGSAQPGGSGWPHGDVIAGAELRTAVAGFTSAFQETYGAGGFAEGDRIGWPLKPGKASVVVYRDGSVDVGRWRDGVPAPGRPVEAVRQNLGLLINDGRIPPSVDTCVKVCWGDPLHEQPIVARSAIGVTAAGALVWAAGHNLSVRALATALRSVGVVRAMELDINPAWVAGYVYVHPRHAPAPVAVPLVPGQTGIPGQFLAPYWRDFLTVDVRTP
jgi:Phosphodiester glycosidase